MRVCPAMKNTHGRALARSTRRRSSETLFLTSVLHQTGEEPAFFFRLLSQVKRALGELFEHGESPFAEIHKVRTFGLLFSLIPGGNVRTLCHLTGAARSAGMTLVRAEAERNTSAAAWHNNPLPTVFGRDNATHPTNSRGIC
jgi:hypothetical protein